MLIDDKGTIQSEKSFSTPDAPERGIFDVLERAANTLDTTVADILSQTQTFAHGTTVSTNALITRRGAKVGVLFTSGFEDTLAIGRGPIGRVGGLPQSQAMDFLHTEPPAPLVRPDMIKGIDERIDANGDILIPLNRNSALKTIRGLVAAGAESFAICFLWAFRNPRHEQQIAAIIKKLRPVYQLACHMRSPLAWVNSSARSPLLLTRILGLSQIHTFGTWIMAFHQKG